MIRLKTLNEVVQSMINTIHDKLPAADTKEGTFIRDTFIDPVADEIDAINIDMKMMEYSQSILTATGEDLDRLATNYNITRKEATVSTGVIRFFIKNTNMDFIISPNTQMATKPTYSEEARVYQTTNTKTIYYIHDKNNPPIDITNADILNIYLPIYQSNLKLGANGYYYYEVNAKSSIGGNFYNIAADNIVIPVDNLDSNILSFTNPIAFTGGTDKESDTNLVLRIKLALQGANIGTKYGYLSYVLKQDGVETAAVVAAMDNDMIRDITAFTYADNNMIHDGGKVDIYVKGEKTIQQSVQIEVTQDNVNVYENGYYTDILLDEQYKPITKVNSISWYTNDNEDNTNFGNLTNTKDYEEEISYTIYLPYDVELYTEYDSNMNITTYMHDAIKEVIQNLPDLNIYTLGTPYKFAIDNENLIYNKIYGTLDDNSDYKYEFIVSDDETVITQEAPFQFQYFINENNEIIFILFTFMGINANDYYQVNQVVLCHVNDAYNSAIPNLQWYYYRNAKNQFNNYMANAVSTAPVVQYYNDIFLTNDLLFSKADSYGGRTFDDNIVYLCEQYDISPTLLYDYTTQTEVQNQMLYNIEYFKSKLNNYEYNLDLGKATINQRNVYNKCNVYTEMRLDTYDPDYLYIDVKHLNNPNITNITFNIRIDNLSNYLDLTDMTYNGVNVYNYGYVENDIFYSTSTFNYTKDIDTGNNYILMGTFKIKINNVTDDSKNTNFSIINAKVYDARNNLLASVNGDSSMSSGEIINSVIDSQIKPIMYYLDEYNIGVNTYKYVLTLPLETDEENYNIPLTFIKSNNELYMRVYKQPDYEFINMNEEMYGNSKNAYYRIHWFNNPLDILGGNIYLTINFDVNTLIQEIQQGIEQVKCLTADVLVKEAVEYPIEIVADICYDETYDKDETYNLITSTIADYVNNNFPMGGIIKLSYLITQMQHIEGVSYVDSTTLKLRRLYGNDEKSITIHQYEYFKLRNLVLNEIDE